MKSVVKVPQTKHVFLRISRNKYLDPQPYCLHRQGICNLVRSGKRGCLDAPCRYQFLKIELDRELTKGVTQ